MIKHVYAILKNADMTEGRGPMVLTGICFTTEQAAIRYCEAQTGVMGRSGERWNRNSANDHSIFKLKVQGKF